jgi:hypothetical protein
MPSQNDFQLIGDGKCKSLQNTVVSATRLSSRNVASAVFNYRLAPWLTLSSISAYFPPLPAR